MTGHQWQQYINKPLLLYVVGMLIVAAAGTWLLTHDVFTWPSFESILLGGGALLLVWQCGVRFPYLGLISMERLVQFHLLLTLPLSEVVIIHILPSLVMPFINKSYRMNSYHVATIRGLNNLAMNTLMMMVAALVLQWGIALPLTTLTWIDVWPIAVAAVLMQAVNITMIFCYFKLDRKKIQGLFTSAYLFADLMFVPVGVMSALLFHMGDTALFTLFIFFTVVLLLAYRSLNQSDQNKEQISINQATDHQISALNLDHLCQTISNRCDQLFNAQAVYLLAVDEGRHQVLVAENRAEVKDLNDRIDGLLTTDRIGASVDQVDDITLHHIQAAFIDSDGIFARLILMRDQAPPFNEADLDMLRLIVRQFRTDLSYAMTYQRLNEYKINLEAKVAMRTEQLEQANKEKSELVERLKKISQTDALTGLKNRRYFDALMNHFQTSQPQQLSLAVIDIDHFKQVNDQLGHDRGDDVLQTIAHIMNQWAPPGSMLARYGGEEFVVVLTASTLKEAEQSLEQLRILVESHAWTLPNLATKITISIGLSHHPETAIGQLFESADAALYQAKAKGRNQLVIQA